MFFKLEAIFAREIIILAHNCKDDPETVRTVSELCFTLIRLFDELGYERTRLDWKQLFDYYDREYYALSHDGQHDNKEDVDKLYTQAINTLSTNE
jgi:hypothetical protein